MNFTLQVWRQAGPDQPGCWAQYSARDMSPDMSFLEMLDVVNEQLILAGEEPIAFDHDCREGICGSCGMVIDGMAHGPTLRTATCQLHLRSFRDGQKIVIEPFRAAAFPVLKDLVVDRRALDRIVQSGGYVSVSTGQAPEGNSLPIAKHRAEQALDAAACIGCGACVAACPNAAAQLFTAAKVSHLARLPQGQVERWERAERMVAQMEQEMFGSCTNYTECEAICPAGISIDTIAQMNREFLAARVRTHPRRPTAGQAAAASR